MSHVECFACALSLFIFHKMCRKFLVASSFMFTVWQKLFTCLFFCRCFVSKLAFSSSFQLSFDIDNNNGLVNYLNALCMHEVSVYGFDVRVDDYSKRIEEKNILAAVPNNVVQALKVGARAY